MWLSNTDEDDKEEERPEELDDQLDLWEQRMWAPLKIDETFCPRQVSYDSYLMKSTFTLNFELQEHLVSPAVCDVLPEQ